MALADTANLAVKITLDDRGFTGPLSKIQRNLGGLNKGFGRVGKGVGQLGAGFARVGYIAAAAAATGIAAAAKAAIDYEDAFAGVRKTVEATPTELQILSDKFRDLARHIPIAATEFARLGEIGGALGIDVNAIDEFVEVTAKLGVTTDLSADQAADALGRIGNILNLTAADYDNFGSALVNLGNKGASTEAEIIDITRRFGAAGKKFGLLTPEILGLAEATASYTGLQPQAAGSSLVRLLEGLTKVVADGGADFKNLNELVGVNFKKAMEDDASGALTLFLSKLSTLDKFEQLAFLKEMGISGVYLSQLLGGLTANVDDLGKSFANADAGWQGNFLNEEAAKKFDTLKQQLILLRNNITDAGITIGYEMLPALKRATERLIAFLQVPGNQQTLKTIGRDIGGAIDRIDWGKVLAGAKTFVGIARTLLTVLSKIPIEIHAAVVALAGLNALSGGLIGAGVGNIVGGLTESIGRSLFTKIPGIGKLGALPVYVVNMGPGGMGGIGGAGKPGIFGRAAGGLGGALGGGAAVGAAAILASGAALVAGLVATQKLINEPGQQREAGENIGDVEAVIATGDARQIQIALDGVRASVANLSPLQQVLYNLNANGIKVHTESLIGALEGALPDAKASTPGSRPSYSYPTSPADMKLLEKSKEQAAKLTAVNVGVAAVSAAVKAARMDAAAKANRQAQLQAATRAAAVASKIAQIAAGRSDTARMISAIHAARPIVSVVVNAATNYTTTVKTGTTSTKREADINKANRATEGM